MVNWLCLTLHRCSCNLLSTRCSVLVCKQVLISSHKVHTTFKDKRLRWWRYFYTIVIINLNVEFVFSPSAESKQSSNHHSRTSLNGRPSKGLTSRSALIASGRRPFTNCTPSPVTYKKCVISVTQHKNLNLALPLLVQYCFKYSSRELESADKTGMTEAATLQWCEDWMAVHTGSWSKRLHIIRATLYKII